MAKNSFNPFDTESSFAGGGSIFTDGTYRVELSGYTLFDFKGGPKKNTPCLMWQLQMLDEKGKDVGDVSIQYWPVTPIGDQKETTTLVDPIKGEKGVFDLAVPTEGSEYDKLWGGSDYKRFIDKLKAAWEESGRDWDQVTCASDFTGLVCGMGKMTIKNDDREDNRDTDDRKSRGPQKVRAATRDVVVVTDIAPEEKSGSKKKAAPKADDEPEEKPSKKGASKAKEVGDEPEDIIEAYIMKELNVKDNFDGISIMNVKLGIGRFASQTLDKSAEVAEAAVDYFVENRDALLKTIGWVVDGKHLKKKE